MIKQVIVMRKDLNMRKGKIAAQAAHASLGVFSKNMYITSKNETFFAGYITFNLDAKEWFESSFTKICVSVDSEEELIQIYENAKSNKLPCILITDNGTTEFNGIPTKTCCAIGPAKSEIIDKITGHLKLL